ncbi:PREDICTED: F-box protein PP2-B15 isoform X1 [Theobroma cacao]|uniref:F-box protein PP2-B15 isoform X1 n=2 Tax=Theobroma cacao TaxID=3641 RepID=A0AB32WDQ2_THECC|nr:PREDICTED: F-box protein PP2-B15 isoform X1 [Theobroma cacao]
MHIFQAMTSHKSFKPDAFQGIKPEFHKRHSLFALKETSLSMLPEDCLSAILSFTTPEDAFRSSLVSSTFRSAVDSDVVWESFLPPDYPEIVLSSVSPLKFSSKKELFQCLCDPVLIDGGNKIFKLEKSSGKKSYMLSAKELSITWSSNPLYWGWISMSESRFSRVAVLRTTDWLEIRGNIRTQILTPNTTYGAYLILKISDRAYGLDSMPSEITVEVGNQVSSGSVFLQHQESKKQREMWKLVEGNHQGVLSERGDRWMEIELGQFFSGENDEEVKMSLLEVKGCHLKGGLVIEGIEVRPKEHQ